MILSIETDFFCQGESVRVDGETGGDKETAPSRDGFGVQYNFRNHYNPLQVKVIEELTELNEDNVTGEDSV